MDFYLIIANTALLAAALLGLFIYLMMKNRYRIMRFCRKHQVLRFFVNVAIPFVVPLVLSIGLLDETFASTPGVKLFIGVMAVIATVNLAAQFLVWLKERKEIDIKWENQAAGHAFNNLCEVYSDRNSQLRTAYHSGLKQGMLTDADVPYDIFKMIRKVTWEFCNTVSKITGIPTKDLDGAFVYHYCYPGATGKDRDWRWVSGKGAKFKPGLNDFVGTADSTFHYMINNNTSVVFYNDKTAAVDAQRYVYSYRDHCHNRTGSIFAAKVAFSGNDHTLCEGIVMVNSYGHQFMDNLPGQTEEDLKELLQDSIFPCYSKLLTTELAMLYFRHQTDEDAPAKNTEKLPNKKLISFLPPRFKQYEKSFKCLIAAGKKMWIRDE